MTELLCSSITPETQANKVASPSCSTFTSMYVGNIKRCSLPVPLDYPTQTLRLSVEHARHALESVLERSSVRDRPPRPWITGWHGSVVLCARVRLRWQVQP